ncbi:DNA polymerase delta subunit 3 [Collichthys lucidus]|uniref:DNA polymerase delta subunit 3 n=1 Tax=Collichthys lucidus TaxID=240159 RepID=A0A4U5UWZ7_COLLU|nr:DNA polymerase delta subunit 3 [Collichthys lucidus]
MDELYLDNIDEFVNDHDKIVTYKWLSLTLGVHVNTAKQMLYHYLDHKRKESSAQLHATYLVSGKFEDNGQTVRHTINRQDVFRHMFDFRYFNFMLLMFLLLMLLQGHKVSVVKEDQLEDFKSKMSLVVSVHVYSVQKALLKDSGPLYSVDYDAVKDNLKNCTKYSAIRCAGAVPMSSLELQQARQIHQVPAPEPEHKKPAMNGEANASKPSTKPQKGIMGMFANKAAPKNQDNVKDIKTEQKADAPVAEAPKSKPAAKANPMMNFFGTQTASECCQQSEQSQYRRACHKSKRVVDSDSEEEKMEKKKRRRIKKPEPDSSDEDVIPDSPQQMKTREPSPSPEKEVEPVSHSPQGNSQKTRKRRRVLKARTFVDDEGCIVTEKCYESESYSETEDDVQATKQASKDPVPAKRPASHKPDEKKSQKKTSANANKGSKQASIMGFFQKK